MPETIAVAWLERPSMTKRWCRALRKTSTTYQDNVKTRCGFTIALPCGMSHDAAIDCEICKEKEQ